MQYYCLSHPELQWNIQVTALVSLTLWSYCCKDDFFTSINMIPLRPGAHRLPTPLSGPEALPQHEIGTR